MILFRTITEVMISQRYNGYITWKVNGWVYFKLKCHKVKGLAIFDFGKAWDDLIDCFCVFAMEEIDQVRRPKGVGERYS